MSRRIEGQTEGRTIKMYQDWELRPATPEEAREVMKEIKEQIATELGRETSRDNAPQEKTHPNPRP